MKQVSKFLILIVGISVAALTLNAEPKGKPGRSELYYEGEIVKTIVPPAAAPKKGTEAFYAVPNQMPVIATAPGDKGYRGGKWAFNAVSWNVAAYPLTSELEVLEAEASGDITVTPKPEMDFKCPVQRN